MVSKIKISLITLFVSSLVAHDNFNKININVDSTGLYSSHIRLDHQSYFYAPNGDIVLLHLAHSPHLKYFQNEVGLGYRKFFTRFGLGLNFYYMHTTNPSIFIHQLSPGIEGFYKDFQISYNLYLPTSMKRSFKKGDLYHSTISEFGLKYSPRSDFSLGILPFYDHMKKQWGLNSKASYTLNNRFEFGISPYLKKEGNGCVFSFGINFGGIREKAHQTPYRSNEFGYFITKKQPKIFVAENVKSIPIQAMTPILPAPEPVILPPIEEETAEEPKETEQQPEAPKDQKPKEIMIPDVNDPKPKSWWDSLPFGNYKGTDIVKKEEPKIEEKKDPELAARMKANEDLYWVPPWEYIFGKLDIPETTKGSLIVEDYVGTKNETPALENSIYKSVIIEDYVGTKSVS